MIKLFASMALLAMSACAPAYAWDLKDMNETIDKTNIILNNNCSGTVVDKENNLILTAFHCIKGAKETQPSEVKTRIYDKYDVVVETKYTASVLVSSEGTDLAILQLHYQGSVFTKQSDVWHNPIYRGETVWVVGNPMMLDYSVVRGNVANVYRHFTQGFKWGTEDPMAIQIAANTDAGNSGGAIYNDEGKIIGVLNFGKIDSGIFFISGPENITELLSKAYEAIPTKQGAQ